MKLKKIIAFLLFILLSFGFYIKDIKAYSCQYKSEQSVEESGGKNSVYGCGSFELTIDDNTGEISREVKFDNTLYKNIQMQVNYFDIDQSWTDYGYLDKGCPAVYSGVEYDNNGLCNIFMGAEGSLDEPQYRIGDNKYTFDYGHRTDEPWDPDEDVPKVDSEYEDEVYTVIGLPDDHQYVNASECSNGDLRRIWLGNIGNGGIEVLGCVGKAANVLAVCGGAVQANISVATRADKTDDKTNYFARVCYNSTATPNAKKQYACYYENNICGNFNVQRDSRGKLTVNGLTYQASTNYLSETAFKDSAECPELYIWLNNSTCYISSRIRAGYTKVGGVLYNEYISDKVWGSNNNTDSNTGLTGTDDNVGYTGMDCYGLLGPTSDPNAPAYWLQKALQVIRYAGIAALFIFSTIDFVKAIVNQDNDALRKAISTTVKRFIYAILIFFVPILTENILRFFGVYGTCAL